MIFGNAVWRELIPTVPFAYRFNVTLCDGQADGSPVDPMPWNESKDAGGYASNLKDIEMIVKGFFYNVYYRYIFS